MSRSHKKDRKQGTFYTGQIKRGYSKDTPTVKTAEEKTQNSSDTSPQDFIPEQNSPLAKRPTPFKESAKEFLIEYWKILLGAVVTAAITYLAWTLPTDMAKMDEKLNTMQKDVEEIKADIDKIEDKDSKQDLRIQDNSKEIEFMNRQKNSSHK